MNRNAPKITDSDPVTLAWSLSVSESTTDEGFLSTLRFSPGPRTLSDTQIKAAATLLFPSEPSPPKSLGSGVEVSRSRLSQWKYTNSNYHPVENRVLDLSFDRTGLQPRSEVHSMHVERDSQSFGDTLLAESPPGGIETVYSNAWIFAGVLPTSRVLAAIGCLYYRSLRAESISVPRTCSMSEWKDISDILQACGVFLLESDKEAYEAVGSKEILRLDELERAYYRQIHELNKNRDPNHHTMSPDSDRPPYPPWEYDEADSTTLFPIILSNGIYTVGSLGESGADFEFTRKLFNIQHSKGCIIWDYDRREVQYIENSLLAAAEAVKSETSWIPF